MNSICFDTETTGLHPNGSDPDEILTISIIGRDGSVLLDERFRPTVKTEWPHASAINGIYPEDVADLPTIETAIPRLREIFAAQVCAIYVVILLSGLLVFWSAIFIDSKGDGNRAAPWQKGLQDGYFGCYGEGQRPRGRDWLGEFLRRADGTDGR